MSNKEGLKVIFGSIDDMLGKCGGGCVAVGRQVSG